MPDSIEGVSKTGSNAFGIVSALCFAYFSVALILLHALKPEYTVVDHMISDYAVGPFGWIMTSAFAAIAIGCCSLAVGLFRNGPRSWLANAGSAMLLIASIGLVVTAIFPTDLETAATTQTGNIHAFSFFVNIVAIVLAAILLGLSYGRDSYWREKRKSALVFAALMIVAFIAQFLTLRRGAPYGITNRAFVAILIAWFISTSLWLRKVPDKLGAR